jgi:hypothetical protein
VDVSQGDIGWRRGSGCDTNTCVEVAAADGLLWLRNTARPEVMLAFTVDEWQVFRRAILAGEFDDLHPDPR